MAPRLVSLSATALIAAALHAAPATAQDAPFEVHTVLVPGRPVEAVALPETAARPRLTVASVEGSPPNERRWISIFPPLEPGGLPPAEPWRRSVEPEVVAFDLAADPASGEPLLALLSSGALRLQIPGAAPLTLDLGADFALPPRTRQLSRLAMLRDWESTGTLAALLPTLGGALLVPLDGSPPRRLSLPVLTEYETMDVYRPVHEGYASARLIWPSLALADDDGDGRLDLFAFTRFELLVLRAGPRGLPAVPTRRSPMPAFSFEEERRHTTNALRAYARDVDGDGLADLVIHRTEGTLLRSHATTTLHRNAGAGASPTSPPNAVLEADGGFGSIELEDLSDDGRLEAFQTFVPFGVLQVVRILARRRVEATLRVHQFAAPGIGAPHATWETDLSYPLDFATARIVGVLPTVAGDWNGDGQRDLLHAEGPAAVRIRLGRAAAEGFGFGRPVARQEFPSTADLAVVADLSGDGLDDLVVYDPLDLEGRLHIALNQGRLPGLVPAQEAEEPAAAESTGVGEPRPSPRIEPARSDAADEQR